ncbi:glycosyltransferase family 2 protein, partial [Streptomyces paradoxus]
VLITANLAATVLRFLLFRAWVFPETPATDARHIPEPGVSDQYLVWSDATERLQPVHPAAGTDPRDGR